MEIRFINQPISNDELRAFLGNPFSDMVKFVVDIEKEVIALGGELHADAEEVLLAHGCKQENLWGANVYPDQTGDDRLEYTSLINIRPSQHNRSMEIQDAKIRERVKEITTHLLSL